MGNAFRGNKNEKNLESTSFCVDFKSGVFVSTIAFFFSQPGQLWIINRTMVSLKN